MKSYEEYYVEFMDSLFNSKNKKSNSIWAAVFFILFIVHGIYFYLIGTIQGVSAGGMVVVYVLIPLGLLLAIIGFIVALFFVIKRKPHGLAKIISYAFLTVISLMLVLLGIGVVNAYFYPLYGILLPFL
jgi:hypothetical protein